MHHVRIVWVDIHVRKRAESCKRTESKMAVELRKWVLACLHRRKRLLLDLVRLWWMGWMTLQTAQRP